MNNDIRVESISQLFSDSDYVNEQSREWNHQVEVVYTTIAELKRSWAGSLSKQYTDDVESYQQQLTDFGTMLSFLAATLSTVANRYRALEQGQSPSSAQVVEGSVFNLVDTGAASTEYEMTFNPDECKQKASTILTAGTSINGIIDEIGDKIVSINNNYSSPKGTEVINTMAKMKEIAPDFVESINKFANCLTDVVAPAYESVENTNDIM